MSKRYLEKNVLEAARERMAFIFDTYDEIQVSVSGGKDSTALLHLALQEAELRGREIEVFWLDQEAEYQATVDLVRSQMMLPNVKPLWYQVPIYMTNATSLEEVFLYAWGPHQEWMRPKDSMAIQSIDDEDHPQRFYEFFPWLEKRSPHKAYLVGLRADESITRYRAVTKNPGLAGVPWSTTGAGDAIRFYPIYDWGWSDVWKFIYDYAIPYNRMYDHMFWANYSMYKMRVSNLVHEKSYKCLVDLPRFEPDTYDKLCKRISGISTASRYAAERLVFSNKQLPSHYKSWKEFRDFLLENVADEKIKQRFAKRFEGQSQNERTYKQQVGQLLVLDYENSKPVDLKAEERAKERMKKWMELL